MPCLRHARGLHNPSLPGRWLLVTAVPPQLCVAVVPPRRVRIPIMRFPLHVPALHIRIPLDDRCDATGLANIAAERKRLVRVPAADIT